MSEYSVVWPRSEKSVAIKSLAPRLPSLEGKTIAFLWDYVFRGDEIWEFAKKELVSRYPNVRFIDYGEFGSTHGDEERAVLEALPSKLRSLKVDAVVSGMGC